MQLIASDLLAEARGLSETLCLTVAAVGVLLWLFGWRGHRFWLAASVTTTAGVVGLFVGRSTGTQLLAVGLLMGVSAGLLALELARLAAFAAGGTAAWLAVKAVVPTLQEPLIAFLVGGLLALVLFRLWVMALTSLAGSILATYSALLLAEPLARLDPVTWARQNAAALNIGVGVATLVGVLAQGLLERWLAYAPYRRKQKALAGLSPEERDHLRDLSGSWFGRFGRFDRFGRGRDHRAA